MSVSCISRQIKIFPDDIFYRFPSGLDITANPPGTGHFFRPGTRISPTANVKGDLPVYDIDMLTDIGIPVSFVQPQITAPAIIDFNKIKTPISGTLKIESMHDEVILTVDSGKEVKKYIVRKADIAKPNELSGVGGKIDGKLYMPYPSGSTVGEGDSIVELIKEGWNVPNRIPYAAELLVEDGKPCPTKIKAMEEGTLKYYFLKGDYLERNHDIKEGYQVTEKGLFAVIADEDDRQAIRHYIPRGSVIKINDNAKVESSTLIAEPIEKEQIVIAEWDPYSNPIISEIAGVVHLEDIVPGVTASEQFDELTGQSRLVVNEYFPSSYKPAIVIAGEKGELVRYALEAKTDILVQEGASIAVADIIAKTDRKSVV